MTYDLLGIARELFEMFRPIFLREFSMVAISACISLVLTIPFGYNVA